MPSGKGTYGTKRGRPPKKGGKKNDVDRADFRLLGSDVWGFWFHRPAR